ncbi:hypothetical protein GCM10012275_54210 [Longimycelium tulufanense]|uniref:Uncharacterized protein n=1 Tax=Longimycelium tulufanense TaxID=907463 RepID=A0A8J3CJM3_9PSEU|nr:hypothetical protein [Longimycelium tulufanense]GGM76648.1 hypothetical protein GCM10012275_54210 [Longimycelium tulufanense]
MSTQPWWVPGPHDAESVVDDEFDFVTEVIGDDLVVGGVVYSRIDWKYEDGEAVRRSPEERQAMLDALAAELGEEDAHRPAASEIEHGGCDASPPC